MGLGANFWKVWAGASAKPNHIVICDDFLSEPVYRATDANFLRIKKTDDGRIKRRAVANLRERG
jgi:hypothetical protein